MRRQIVDTVGRWISTRLDNQSVQREGAIDRAFLGSKFAARPKGFEAVRVDADGRLVVASGVPPRQVIVLTCQLDGLMFAVASLPSGAADDRADVPWS